LHRYHKLIYLKKTLEQELHGDGTAASVFILLYTYIVESMILFYSSSRF